MPYMKAVQLNRAVVAPSIYGTFPHEVIDVGLVLEHTVVVELERFLGEYTNFLEVVETKKFFRIDLYFDDNTVYVIEVNVEIADGWGVALNLQRAAGFPSPNLSAFPEIFPTFPGDPRQSEFCLAIKEFAQFGHTANVCEQNTRIIDPLDSKIHLACFAEQWVGEHVLVPAMYHCGNTVWDSVPEDVYLKFAEKFCPEAVKSRYSVKSRSELGRANQMRKLFAEGRAIAQARVEPFQTKAGEQVQAVIMCAGTTVVTGYIQVAPGGRKVINDKGTKKGPLRFL